MRSLAIALVMLFAVPALAETQAVKQARIKNTLRHAGMSGSYTNILINGTANVFYYDTAVELLAATPTDGILGYAIDTDAMYLHANDTWIALLGTSGILGTNGGTFGNETNNVWTLGENSEDLTLTFASDLVTLASSTGALFTLTPATTITGDLTLNGGAGALTFGADSSSVVVPDNSATALVLGSAGRLDLLGIDSTDDNEKVVVKGTTTTDAFHVDVGDAQFDEDIAVTGAVASATLAVTGNAKLGTTLAMVGSAYFCGNGANATTAVYMPPLQVSTAADMTTYEYGAPGCDGLDNTSETDGDDLLEGNGALDVKVVGMACGISAAGTDDTYTFQLRDDAADVTGVTCNVTLDGSIQACSVLLDAPVTVAAGSLWAVKSVADTDDNVSSADVECQVFYTY